MSDLIFLDTETTGLDPEKHDVWEIAWAVNDGPIRSVILPHSIVKADIKALNMNGYWDRVPGHFPDPETYDITIRGILEGNTLVCANPTFDRMFLWRRWGYEPYHYRSIDIESMALLCFEWERPRGLKDIVDELNSRVYDIDKPDHSAAKDVEVLRACYKAIRLENNKYKIY